MRVSNSNKTTYYFYAYTYTNTRNGIRILVLSSSSDKYWDFDEHNAATRAYTASVNTEYYYDSNQGRWRSV